MLDLGTGSGLVAIAAAKAGARTVEAVDIDAHAIAAAELNAAANHVRIGFTCADPASGEPPPADLILVGDLFYDPDAAARITAFLRRCVASGIRVLVGDPGRRSLPRNRLRPLAVTPVRETGTIARPATVYAFT